MEKFIRMNNIIQVIRNTTSTYPKNIALESSERKISYSELLLEIEKLSEKLKTIGLTKNHKVSIISDNSINFFILLLSLLNINCKPLLINRNISKNELTKILEKFKPNVSFHYKNKENVNLILSYHYNVFHTTIDNRIDDVELFMHTSGTTGNNKIVALSKENIYHGARKTKIHRNITSNDKLYLVIPATFIFGLNLSFGLLYSGATIYIANKIRIIDIKNFSKNKISMISLTPESLSRFYLIIKQKNINLNLRYISYGGDSLSSQIKNQIESHLDLLLANGYGMTETTATISINDGTMKGVGSLIEGLDIKFLDKYGNNTSKGEICLKGNTIAIGYYNSNTGVSKFKDNWFKTGDYGYFDDNNLILLGRINDLICINNIFYSPAKIEHIIFEKFNIKCIIQQINLNNIIFVKKFTDYDKNKIQKLLKEEFNINLNKFIEISKFPLSYNGKIKRNLLTNFKEEINDYRS
jgi:long-subunit acyl-CoA synthetase (AMP-forming)